VNRKVLNIGSGRETTIEELVSIMENTSGRRANRVYNLEKQGGVKRLVADIDQARKLLGFRPRVSLKDGLEQMLAEDARFGPT
jgi:UDP-glucose 4-epimerase